LIHWYCFILIHLIHLIHWYCLSHLFIRSATVDSAHYRQLHMNMDGILPFLSHFLLNCPASDPLWRAIFGTNPSIFDLGAWSFVRFPYNFSMYLSPRRSRIVPANQSNSYLSDSIRS